MNTKEIFASYLEETAAEIRAFTMCREYLDDIGASLIKHTRDFCNEEHEKISEANSIKCS